MTIKNKKYEEGNVLFLILIAVALFAALSYAVTQSSRSGGGDASDETNAINAASMTQYPTGLRTSVLRMSVDGTAFSALEFNAPNDFNASADLTDCTDPDADGTTGDFCIFDVNGGGAGYQDAPASVMDPAGGNVAGRWYFNSNFSITDVGGSGNELIAFLPGIRIGVCEQINNRLDINAISTYGSDELSAMQQTIGAGTGYTGTNGTVTATAGSTWPTALDGQPYGCFQNNNTSGIYVYYHTLAES